MKKRGEYYNLFIGVLPIMVSQTRQELARARESAVAQRYEPLRQRLFGDTNWKYLDNQSRGSLKASFRLDINFNRTASITAYDFMVEMNQIFSKAILPVRLDNGCINIVAQFEDYKDYLGVDFRERLFEDEEYQDILSAYAVTDINLFGFPLDKRFPASHLRVDEQGQPRPA